MTPASAATAARSASVAATTASASFVKVGSPNIGKRHERRATQSARRHRGPRRIARTPQRRRGRIAAFAMSSTPAPAAVPLSVPLTRHGAIALLLVFALAWFCNLGDRRLLHPDEGRYAEIPREMVATGDWVTPRLDGVKYFEKPALQYWLTAAGYEAFGVHEWTARLWPALAGFLGVLFIGYVGRRLGGPLLGLYAAAVLAGSVGYVLDAHLLTLDTGLTLWMSVGLGGLFLAQ